MQKLAAERERMKKEQIERELYMTMKEAKAAAAAEEKENKRLEKEAEKAAAERRKEYEKAEKMREKAESLAAKATVAKQQELYGSM